jgi:hypothetical protein
MQVQDNQVKEKKCYFTITDAAAFHSQLLRWIEGAHFFLQWQMMMWH